MSELVLIRHGAAIGQGAYNGRRSDPPLSGEGRLQARNLKNSLDEDGISAKDAGIIYTSPMRRAVETAQIIFGADEYQRSGLTVIPEFAEIDFGEWDGLRWEEISKSSGIDYSRWLEDPVNCAPPGGETLPVFGERVMKGFKKITDSMGDDERKIIVTHGGVIRSMICSMLMIQADKQLSFRVDCASYSILHSYTNFKEGIAVLSALNRL